MRQRSLLFLFGGLLVITLVIQLPLWMVVVSRHHERAALHLPGRPDAAEIEPMPEGVDEGDEDVVTTGASNRREAVSSDGAVDDSRSTVSGGATAAVATPSPSRDWERTNESIVPLFVRRVAPPLALDSVVNVGDENPDGGTHTAVVVFSLSTVDEQTLPWHVVTDVVQQSAHLRNGSRLTVSIVTRIHRAWWVPGGGVQFEGSEVCEWFRVLRIDCRSLQHQTPFGGVVQLELWGIRGGGARRVPLTLARRAALTAWATVTGSPRQGGNGRRLPHRLLWWYFSPFIDPTTIPWEIVVAAGRRGSSSLPSLRPSGDASLLTVAVVAHDVVVNGGHRLRFGDNDALLLSHEMRGYSSSDVRIHGYAAPSFDRVPSPLAFGVSSAALDTCWPSHSVEMQSALERWSTAVHVLGSGDGAAYFCFPEDTAFITFLRCLYETPGWDTGAAQSGVVVSSHDDDDAGRDCGGDRDEQNRFEDGIEDDGVSLQSLLQHADHYRQGNDAANRAAETWIRQVSQRLLEHIHGDKVLLEWETFCIPCFGFSNEVMQYLVPLEGLLYVHTTNEPGCFCPGAPNAFRESLRRIGGKRSGREGWKAARRRRDRGESDGESGAPPLLIHVAHKDPGSFPQFSARERPDVVIGRAMYEFTRLPAHWVSHKADVDEVWVPCRFVKWVFERAGFAADAIVVIPEPIDVFFYDPSAVLQQVELPPPRSSPWNHASSRASRRLHHHQASTPASAQTSQSSYFKFFSVFKWEDRKGWEELLLAYVTAFSSDDAVSLYLATYVYGEARDAGHVLDRIETFVRSRFNRSLAEVPHIHVISEQLSETEMVGLYAAADAFVLATKGEGWGLPAIQAMSMALPTIVTNWSGVVDFATAKNAFLIPVAEVEELPAGSPYGAEAGKLWAVPNVTALEELMRFVFTHPDEARHRGRRARRDIIAQFSSEAVAQMVRTRVLALAREKQKPHQERIREAVEALLDDRHLIV